MGTMGSMVSLDEIDKIPGVQIIIAFRTIDRCEYIDPLGLPVVPDV